MDLQKDPNVAYHVILDEFGSIWCGKGLIVTYSNLVVSGKVQP